MTKVVALVKLSARDQERIRTAFPHISLIDAGGWFDGEYRESWPAATAARYIAGQGQGSRADRDALLADAEVVIAGFPFPLDLKARAPRLRWLHQTPAGASNLRRGDIWGADTLVTTSRGFGETTAIAEYVLAATTYFLKDFHRAEQDAVAGSFDYGGYAVRSVWGRVMCVIGAGGIGREVGRLAKANGMRVLGTRRNLAAAPGDEYFDELRTPDALLGQLGQADVVAVCCQWTPETTKLLSDEAFEHMRDDTVLVNVARGEIIDEQALERALHAGKLRGVGLDVYVGEFEHLPPSALWSHPKVLITPHTSAKTDASRRRSTDAFIDNMTRYLAGEPLRNRVDWSTGY